VPSRHLLEKTNAIINLTSFLLMYQFYTKKASLKGADSAPFRNLQGKG
jgi:hypothetical protein